MTRDRIICLGLICLSLLASCSMVNNSNSAQPIETAVAGPEFITGLAANLAEELDVEADDIHLADVEQVQWRDSCLGVDRKGMMCLEVITPGYQIIFDTPDGRYEAHTNEDGTTYLFIPQETSPTNLP